MNVKKLAIILGIGLFLLILKNPDAAAKVVHAITGGLETAGDSISRFIDAL